MQTESLFVAPPEEKHLWTYAEWEKQPETLQPTELWNGELIVSPAPTPDHQRIVMKLGFAMNSFVEARELGTIYLSPIDVVLSDHRVMQPDIVFVAKENGSIVQKAVQGAPDLAVEVVSEGSWRRDRIDKKALYEQFGVKEYWIVDPEARMIEIFVLTEEGYKHHARVKDVEKASSRLLTGLQVSFREIEL